MSSNVRVVRVLASSPSDTAEEQKGLKEVLDRINETKTNEAVRLEPWDWSMAVPRIGPSPQDVIDAQTPPYDVYIGIMSGRFGTPTGPYGSGTEKEFRDALDKWGDTGAPWIIFYFNDAPDPFPKKSEDVAQYLKVTQFKEELEGKGLVAHYQGPRGRPEAFFEQVELHLRKVLDKLQRRSPAMPKPKGKGPAPIPPAYLEWLRSDVAGIELLGLRLKQGTAVHLNNIYVPLTTTRPEQDRDPAERTGPEKPLLLLDRIGKES